ncbi:EamA family transporter [Halalkalibacillus sediminis]|uniref:EamA family transporter n=1 Tax=Halalkalibacillus sediminis TaxID=2018042 RepID=A0A2I0QUM7_9BACI|nr:EamA family transporter [Halalkalibacillus sediminis]PKR78052.1 EamA family transporter [Halalkalibacillus sediminis]
MKLYIALFSLSLIWGLSFVFIKVLIEPAGIFGMVFLRCLLGALVLIPFIWARRRKINFNLPWKHLIIVGIFNAALPWGLIAWSETVINSSSASVINALTPIATGFIGFLLFGKILAKKQWIGIITGFVGILVLMNFEVGALLGSDFIGIGTMILATLCYGFGSQYTKRFVVGVDLFLMTAVTLLIASLSALAGGFMVGDVPAVSEFDWGTIGALIGLGVFGSGIAHVIYYYMMTEGSPEFATTVTYIVPVSAMIWGYVLLNEPITSNLLLGMFIIFAGIYLTNRPAKKVKRSPLISKAS